jgi:hypothetical protein
MLPNPYATKAPESLADPSEPSARRPGLILSTWAATKRGVRIAVFVGGAIAFLPAAALTAFGLGSGYGWGGPRFYLYGVGYAAFFGLFGGVVAAFFGFIGGLLRAVIRRKLNGKASAGGESPHPGLAAAELSAPSVVAAVPRKRRMIWPWLTIAPAVILLAVSFGAGAYLGGVVERRGAAASEAADRDDAHWRWSDLIAHREHVPDTENGALVMDEVLSLVPDSWLRNTKPSADEQTTRVGQLKADFTQLETTPANVRLTEDVAESLGVEFATREPAVQLARNLERYHRGGRDVEFFRVILRAPLPKTMEARVVARLLFVDAALLAHDGSHDAALDSCRAIFGVGRSIGDEPFIFAQLVRFAVGGLALNATRRVLGQGEPSDAALARLHAATLDELAQPLLLIALRGERAALTARIRMVGAGEAPVSALVDSLNSKTNPRVLPHPNAPWAGIWFEYQHAVTLDWMNRAVEIARRPAADQPPLWKIWQLHALRVKETQFRRFVEMLPVLFSPAVAANGSAFSRYQAELGATVILIAAERHRQKTGAWPASIAEIDAEVMPQAPIDPYSGQSFHMEHRDRQLFVYSVGPNGEDEHGKFDPKKLPNFGHDDLGASAWDVSLRGLEPGNNQ